MNNKISTRIRTLLPRHKMKQMIGEERERERELPCAISLPFGSGVFLRLSRFAVSFFRNFFLFSLRFCSLTLNPLFCFCVPVQNSARFVSFSFDKESVSRRVNMYSESIKDRHRSCFIFYRFLFHFSW